MQTAITNNDIRVELEALNRNVTGKTTFTAGEVDIVNSSIVDAYQLVLMEYGVDNFRFHRNAVTVDTVSGQNYVELAEYAFKVVNGSVRIPAKNALLSMIDEEVIFQDDPDLSETGQPTQYAYTGSDDPDIIRLTLWPTPDAVYTINLTTMDYPTDLSDNFPVALQSAIKNKAKALSLLALGMQAQVIGFERAYEEIIAKIKDGYEFDGARHVGRRRIRVRSNFTEQEA